MERVETKLPGPGPGKFRVMKVVDIVIMVVSTLFISGLFLLSLSSYVTGQ